MDRPAEVKFQRINVEAGCIWLSDKYCPQEVSSHELLAEVLSFYPGREMAEHRNGRAPDASDLESRLVYGPHGKPELPGGPAFSISHSGTYWGVLIGCEGNDCPVGLDLQVPAAASFESIAKRFFREEEAEALSKAADAEEKKDLFFRLWTKREALLKAAGESVFRRVKPFTDYEVRELELAEGLYAAYAVKRMK